MQVTLYVAERYINYMMKAFDLCDEGKVYCTKVSETIECKGQGSTEEFLKSLLAFPSHDERFYVAAVEAEGLLAVREGIRMLSDGNKIRYVGD